MTAELLDLALRATVLLALAGLAALALRRAPAVVRHLAWAIAVAGALLLPALLCLPAWRVACLPAAPAMAASGTASVAPSSIAWLPLLWLAGTLAVLAWQAAGHLRLWRLVRASRPVEGWDGLLAECRAALGLSRPVRLRTSPAAPVPLTCGLLRPMVVLPASAAEWPLDRRRLLLLHELAHIRRHDCLTQVLAGLSCALYWWNPLAWLADTRLRVERERCCDDLVVARVARPSEYAGHLLAIALALPENAALPAPAIGAARRGGIEARVRAILAPGPRRGASRLAVPAGLLAAALLLAPLGLLRPVRQARPVAATPVPAARAEVAAPTAPAVEVAAPLGLAHPDAAGRADPPPATSHTHTADCLCYRGPMPDPRAPIRSAPPEPDPAPMTAAIVEAPERPVERDAPSADALTVGGGADPVALDDPAMPQRDMRDEHAMPQRAPHTRP